MGYAERRRENVRCSYLGCEVLWRATEGLHGSSVCDALLAKAKVCDLHVSVLIQHQVLQLGGNKTASAKGVDQEPGGKHG